MFAMLTAGSHVYNCPEERVLLGTIGLSPEVDTAELHALAIDSRAYSSIPGAGVPIAELALGISISVLVCLMD